MAAGQELLRLGRAQAVWDSKYLKVDVDIYIRFYGLSV